MFEVLVLMFLLSMSSGGLGMLLQVHVTESFCAVDSISFRCVSHESVDWSIVIPNGNSFTSSFSNIYNSMQDTNKQDLGTTTVEVTIEAINSSYISSIIILTNATLLNGTAIGCNGDIITFVHKGVSSVIEPNVLVLTQLGSSLAFSASWTLSVSATPLNNYNITITQTQSNKTTLIVTNHPSFTMKIQNHTSYNVTIESTLCDDMVFSDSFVVGNCRFHAIPAVEVIYMVFSNGSIYGTVMCFNRKEVFIYCENNNWMSDISDVCDETDLLLRNGSANCDDRSERIQEPKATEDIVQLNAKSCDLNTLIIVGLCCGFLFFTLLVSLLSFFLGLLCKYKRSNSIFKSVPSAYQVYDEVNAVQTREHFNLTSNDAYGEVSQKN